MTPFSRPPATTGGEVRSDPPPPPRRGEAAFHADGFKGTNLEAIAAEAGCAKGALYLEFSDKEALLREVVEEVFTAIRMRFAAEVLTIESPLGRLRETLCFAYQQAAAEPLFGKLLLEDPELRALRPGEDAGGARAALAQVALLRGWIDEGVARGEIRPDIDREAIPLVLGVLRFLPQHVEIVASLGLQGSPVGISGVSA